MDRNGKFGAYFGGRTDVLGVGYKGKKNQG